MDGLGYNFLACTGFAFEENGGGAGGDEADKGYELMDGRAGADEAGDRDGNGRGGSRREDSGGGMMGRLEGEDGGQIGENAGRKFSRGEGRRGVRVGGKCAGARLGDRLGRAGPEGGVGGVGQDGRGVGVDRFAEGVEELVAAGAADGAGDGFSVGSKQVNVGVHGGDLSREGSDFKIGEVVVDE